MAAQKSEKKKPGSWFYQWFLNNKVTVVLINILLFLAVIWVFASVSWVFQPVGDFLAVALPPILLAGILFYLIEPLVELAERHLKIPRILTISLIFVAVFALIVWGIVNLIPIIQNQTQQILDNWPLYWKNIENTTRKILNDSEFATVRDQLNQQVQNISSEFTKQLNSSVSSWFSNIGSAVGAVTNVLLVLGTAPFILFFMLKDGPKFKGYLLKFVPTKFRHSTGELLTAVNLSLSNYIRGQLTVAFWVGVMFSVGYAIIGQKYALTLGVLAGFLNLIPYLGSFLAIIPALIIAAFTNTFMVMKVLIVFMIEQTIESRVVSPLVVGSKMEMHPATTLILLLAAGKMFGLLGVLLGIPTYAVVKILVARLFDWFKTVTGLYDEEEQLGLVAPPDDPTAGAAPPTAEQPKQEQHSPKS